MVDTGRTRGWRDVHIALGHESVQDECLADDTARMLECEGERGPQEASSETEVLSWDISEDNYVFLTRTATKAEAASTEGFTAWDKELNSFRSNRVWDDQPVAFDSLDAKARVYPLHGSRGRRTLQGSAKIQGTAPGAW